MLEALQKSYVMIFGRTACVCCWIVLMSSSPIPCSACLSFGKREKSHRAKSGEYWRSETTDMPLLARNLCTGRADWTDCQDRESILHCATSWDIFAAIPPMDATELCSCWVNLWCAIPWMLRNPVSVLFTLGQTCQALGCRDDGLFHWADCCFVLVLFPYIHVSPFVMTFKRNYGLHRNIIWIFWYVLTLFCFSSWVSTWSTDFALILSCWDLVSKYFDMIQKEVINSLAKSQTVMCLCLWTCSLNHISYSSVLVVDEHPECSASATDIICIF